MKRSHLKKKSPQKTAALKRKLWKVFADWVKIRDDFVCFTCGHRAEGSGMHAGHFISKQIGGLLLYFHPDNVHAQCFRCNIHLGGNQYIYGEKLGMEKVNELRQLQQKVVKWNPSEYLIRIEFYTYLIKHGQLPEDNQGFEGRPIHYESPRSGARPGYPGRGVFSRVRTTGDDSSEKTSNMVRDEEEF